MSVLLDLLKKIGPSPSPRWTQSTHRGEVRDSGSASSDSIYRRTLGKSLPWVAVQGMKNSRFDEFQIQYYYKPGYLRWKRT